MSDRQSVEFVIPVLNEERGLPVSIQKLHGFLVDNFKDYDWRIVVADNGSTDRTPLIVEEISKKHGEVGYLRLEERGRGRALRTAWLASDADYLCYMDVDLSTELEAIPRLIDSLASQGFDLAIGSRLKKGAKVVGRSLKREIISRGYNLIVWSLFFVNFQDAQCGFKAITRKAAHELAPLVEDNSWFFDTELLIVAEKNGYRINEIPVEWTDDPDSRVKIVKTASDDMKGLLRIRFGGLKWASKRLKGRATQRA
jgi:glycosyltransferase involved in cell wall biosynthesis